jgi:glycosyltransferase involved in cell wall biosynthesis
VITYQPAVIRQEEVREAARPTRELAGTRILAVMPSIPVLGMERANLQILSMMQRRGADVLVIVNDVPGEKISAALDRLGLPWARVPVTERPRLPRSARDFTIVARAWIAAARGIDRVHRRYRPTHVHLTGLAYVLFGAVTLWRTNAVTVLRQPNVADRELPPIKQRLHDVMWRRLIAPLCRVIVCNSRCSRDRLAGIGVPQSKLRLIHNCVAELWPPQARAARRDAAGALTVVFVGQIAESKGAAVLRDAAMSIVRQHQDVTFQFIGWLSPYARQLADDLEARGLADRIQFVGERDDPGELLAAADLHVCPSLCDDSFPNTVLEAKSHGIPSVVFPSGGLPEQVTHLVDGYVCRGKTAEALRDGLLHFIRDRESLRRAGDAAKASLARFAPEPIAAQWAEVFRPAAGGRRA